MAAKLESQAQRHRLEGFTRGIALALGVGVDSSPSDASLTAMVCERVALAQSTESILCEMQDKDTGLRVKLADVKSERNESIRQIAVLKHELAGLKEDLKFAKSMGFVRGSVPKGTIIKDNTTLSQYVLGKRSDL